MLHIDNRAWLLWASWVLLIPLRWVLSAVLAALIHEGFHIAAVYLLGGRICRVKISFLGAVIEAHDLDCIKEAVCAIAGPIGSLLLGLLIRRFPILGICALAQGGFNLMPIYPLDGGRALLRLLECSFSEQPIRMFQFMEMLFLVILLIASCVISLRYCLGIYPILVAFLLILRALLRKRP